MADSIKMKAGDTEPIEFTISGEGIDNLDNLSSASLYARRRGADSNHVDGGTLTVVDSATRTLRFDPVGEKDGGGDAFDAAGDYQCYTLATWDDGDETRHPGDGYRFVRVDGNFE